AAGELAQRAAHARARLRRCVMCPRNCRVNRLAGELGVCQAGALARVASAGPHFGEEASLVGQGGSGTIFFAGCNLTCVFCQNYDISQPAGDRPKAWEYSVEELAHTMLQLQGMGCENINLVSPSHVVPQILEALVVAVEGGLRLPLVYNTGGYDALPTLRLLDGVFDIYMPDIKYADDWVGERFSGVADYVGQNRAAVREMHRQVGDLEIGIGASANSGASAGSGASGEPPARQLRVGAGPNAWAGEARQGPRAGVACRGLLVRHLVLPGGLAGTAEVMRFISEELSPATYVKVMGQYRPAQRVARHPEAYPEVCHPPSQGEYRAAVGAAKAAGLIRLDSG
ncbi:MAG: hypothetical protein M1274_05995, partial [Actinobacteria bacterium]|nr:hypothetical protein [Actinomycetota bacterium]